MLFCFAATALAQSPSSWGLWGPISYAVGGTPSAVAVGDFNGDGKLDLVVGVGTYVSVLLGNGDGTFQAAVSYPIWSNASSIAVGDFNGDGKLDLAVAGLGDLSILLGNGDGTFQAAVDYPNPGSLVAVGDFNGDGRLDLAVLGVVSGLTVNWCSAPPIEGASCVNVLLGNGDGTFQAPVSSFVGYDASSLAVGDFNGDGKLDLAVVATNSSASVSCVNVLVGNGNGTFQAAVSYPISSGASSIAVGDFNGDGKLDLAVAGGDLSILLGNGDGTFSVLQTNLATTTSPLAAADFNGDGKLDLVQAVGQDAFFKVFLGNGDGTFQAGVPFQDPGQPGALAVGDFNGEGLPSVAFANALVNTVDVFLNTTKLAATLSATSLTFTSQPVGALSPPQTVTLTNSGSAALMVGGISVVGDFEETNDCPSILAVGAQCTISVTFQPAVVGACLGTLNIGVDALNALQPITLMGTGVAAPVANVAVTALTFEAQPVGTTSAAQSVTLSNTGSAAALTISGIAISHDFSEANNCGGSVSANGFCTINVAFTPTSNGTLTGTLTISDNSNGVQGSTQTVSLTGTGTAPEAGFSTAALTFAALSVKSTSSSQTVTLSNSGSLPLAIASVTVSGDFSQTNNCAGSVAAGGSCAVNVTFTPSASGTRTGTLMVTDNSNNVTGATQTVSLSGTGEDFTLATPSGSSSSQTASPGQSATYTLSVGGEGGFSQAVTFTCTGAPSESTCTVSPNSVTVGSSATNITVTVATTAASVSLPRFRPHPLVPPLLPLQRDLVMFGVILAGLAWAVRGWRRPGRSGRRAALATLAAGLLLTLVMAACGGGGGSSGSGPTNSGTPAGTYNLTVTGTAGSGSTALSHSVALTLTVT